MPHLYHWVQPDAMAHDSVLQGKQPYLNEMSFLARFGIYFIAWGWTARWFLKRSIEQDGSGDINLTLRMERWSGPSMVIFAFTATFASFEPDHVAERPNWYSTVFGVYFLRRLRGRILLPARAG